MDKKGINRKRIYVNVLFIISFLLIFIVLLYITNPQNSAITGRFIDSGDGEDRKEGLIVEWETQKDNIIVYIKNNYVTEIYVERVDITECKSHSSIIPISPGNIKKADIRCQSQDISEKDIEITYKKQGDQNHISIKRLFIHIVYLVLVCIFLLNSILSDNYTILIIYLCGF